MSVHEEETRSSREMVNFIVLALVLLGAVVIVAVTRPLIFGKIVPAVMGEGIELPTTESDITTNDDTPDEAPTEEREDGETADTDTTSGEEINEAETAYPAPNDTANEADTSTGVPAGTTHTVKQGETLQTIAAQYGLTLQQLIAANTLPNPDYIRIGDTLVIPQLEGEE